jgi:toxin YoeB
VRLVFSDLAWDQYRHWIDADPKILEKLNELIDECRRTPFKGRGKPEPLKGDLAGWWSRRLTQDDRLVYRISGKAPDQQIEIAQCRFHY